MSRELLVLRELLAAVSRPFRALVGQSTVLSSSSRFFRHVLGRAPWGSKTNVLPSAARGAVGPTAQQQHHQGTGVAVLRG